MSQNQEPITDFNLEDFSWDQEDFSQAVVDDNPAPVAENEDPEPEEKKEVKPEVIISPDGKTVEGSSSEEDEDEEGEDSEEGDKAKKANTESGAGAGNENLRFLKEKGLIDFEDADLEDPDFDEEEFIEEKFEEKLGEKLEGMLTGLPEGLKAMIKFASQGGDYMDVVKDLTSPSELSADLDIEDVDSQKAIITHLLKKEGKDKEYIDSNIEFLEYKGTLKSMAEKEYNKFLVEEETKEERRLAEHKEKIKAQNAKMASDKSNINEFLSTKPKVLGGIKFDRKETKELPSYMVDPQVTLADGRVTTKFNKDLVEALGDKEKSLVLAKLVRSGFNMQEFFKNIETSVIDQVEGNLQRRNSGKSKSVVTGIEGSSQSNHRTHLVDFL